MADIPKPVDPRIDPGGWAGEPDLVPVYALSVCLIVGAVIFLLSAVAHI